MKNNFYIASAAAIVAMMMGLSACEKKQDVQPDVQPVEEKQDIALKNGRLVFKDRSAFESHSTKLGNLPEKTSAEAYLDAVEQKLGFVSMRSAFNPLEGIANGRTKSEENCIEDEYLASMLSPEGIVQIDDYIYKLDVCNEKVYALKVEDEAYIAELTKDIPTHEKITVFSTSDEVLNLVEAGEEGSPIARVSALCFRESGASERKDEGDEYYNIDLRLSCRLVYQKAGVYFSIQSKAQYQKLVTGVWFSTIGYLGGSWNGAYKVKCKNWGYPYGSGTNGGAGDDGSSWSQRLYESSNALNKYNCDVQFVNYTQGLYSRVYHIEDNW